ncbi:hypothetical protein AAZX31_13G249800 [Glycine max]|uniref:WRKY DNA-binding transcription factor 70-like isoform X2 n=1 Tax=Glycine soja TaxID=3848 RepID=UPI00103E5D93|nr:WRKY DNA-binding transcription factor 70-like isoform X2 [Glycine soja]
MENQPSNGRKAIEEELIKGRDIANQLLEILAPKSNTTQHKGVEVEALVLPFAEDLVRKVLRSLTNTLLLLNTHSDHVSDEVVLPVTIKGVSSSVKCQKPEYKDESFNAKRRSGSYKRNAPTWEKNSSILMEDGYAWRKYGQKMTMNAKYLRNYYRCTHKYDQGCLATKQVQRIQEDPPLYHTTYYGHHNCKSSLMLEPASSSDSSMFLSFSNTFPSKAEYPFSSSLYSSMKQEPMEVIHEDHIVHNQLPSSDYHMLCDYDLDFNYSRYGTMLSSTESVQFDEVCRSDQEFDG